MKILSIKQLKVAFPEVTNVQIELMNKLCSLADDAFALEEVINTHCQATANYAQSCYTWPFDSSGWRRTMILHAIDDILGTMGVESLGESESLRDGPPYQYLNSGDVYTPTLVYKDSSDNLYISCVATIAGHVK